MKTAPDLHGVTITSTERLKNSVNGNPRFRLTLDDGSTYVTQSDAACNYEVSNYANSGRPFDAWLTKSGRVAVMQDVRS